jgi:hypothetical protein
MSLAIVITLDVIWIPLICLFCAICGFIIRSVEISKLKKQVFDLEKQSFQSDAEILALQKENGLLQEKLKNVQVPVIPITAKENPDKFPDAASRKKLLEKSSAKHHP